MKNDVRKEGLWDNQEINKKTQAKEEIVYNTILNVQYAVLFTQWKRD